MVKQGRQNPPHSHSIGLSCIPLKSVWTIVPQRGWGGHSHTFSVFLSTLTLTRSDCLLECGKGLFVWLPVLNKTPAYLGFISHLLCGVCVPISAGKMVNLVSLVISSSGSCKTQLTHWSTSMYPKQRNKDIRNRITNNKWLYGRLSKW